jgi:uncharacterized protein YeaC (DUF1315 family)
VLVMDFEKLIENITPDIHLSLKRAIEIGKWPDGKTVTQEQRSLCMEAVIAYDNKFLTEAQRVGYIDRGSKADGELCDDDTAAEKPLKWS